ncbi:MAG: carbamoyl-phosphate synthase (glutamine-hydrolyzing) small subunit [Candidatus Magasanikbacteria bacterium]|nr:carbamoyl-phosphate synthase (glutamine-hydrolyzing) small subunit [Candidatus Magasanikbacteria bacterium]
MQLKPSQLILKNGRVFPGLSPAHQKGQFHGEVVFNTGMTGYVETLTDPSYNGQILTFTYPLIGNYGVPGPKTWESKKIHLSGVVVSEACEKYSHSTALRSLLEWLKDQQVPILMGVDTRALTKVIRESGVMLGAILCGEQNKQGKQIRQIKHEDPNDRNLVAEVSIKKPKTYGTGKKKIIAVDCGMKENIIRSLQQFPWTIERVPYNYDYTKEKFDGLFLSNGPGDPAACTETIAILKKAIKMQKPIMGICLGSQLMALAAGAKTYKLPFGHRGQNQPCQEVESGKCSITSQNHGYAVDEKTLPKGWYVNFRNLNDNSVEGVAHKTLPFFSVQFHPEASPGPVDTRWLFEKFYDLV